jgi:diguanylate cyclase (GGDEF)-like protein
MADAVQRPGGRGLTPRERLWWLAVTLGFMALAVWLWAPPSMALPAVRLSWWALAVLFFVADRFPLIAWRRSLTPTAGLIGAPLIVGLFFATPLDLVLGYLVGALLSLASRRMEPLVHTYFALAQFLLVAGLAEHVFQPIVTHAGSLDGQDWLAAYCAASLLIPARALSLLAIRLEHGRMSRATIVEGLISGAISATLSATIGLCAVELLWSDPKGLVLLAIIAGALLVGLRAWGHERHQREVLEFLHGAGQSLHGSRELESAVLALISRARTMFDAEMAQLTLYPALAGEQAYRTTVRGSDAEEVMSGLDVTELDDILELERDSMLVQVATAPQHVRDMLERRDVDDAMVALLTGDQRIIGSLLIGGHAGDIQHFDDDDLRLFETLARQTADTLDNGRLDQSVAQLNELREKLAHTTFYDSLTDLANRSLFTERLDQALTRHDRTGLPVAVLFIDLDDFKSTNDTLGHGAGDELLIGVSDRLKRCLRRPDTAARLGGDEFAVLLEDLDDAHEAETVARRIVAALQQPLSIKEREVRVHASIGIVISEQAGDTASDLMRSADVAMYAAKAAGKDCIMVFAPGMETAVVARHQLRTDLETAIAESQLLVHYQPVVDLETGNVTGSEALIRWQHPTRGLIPPIEFITLAEETGLIIGIGAFVLREACRQLKDWQGLQPDRELSVAVNISARQLQQPLFVEDVLAAVHECEIRPEGLILELTESVLVEDSSASIGKLESLRRSGIRIAIDDFGTGYSSLSYLRKLPADILKIAKPFVDDLADERQPSDFARAIIALGGALNLTTVAEGIEARVQVEKLRALGCPLGQGYHLARPGAPEAMTLLLRDGISADRLGAAEPADERILRLRRKS